MRWCDPPNHQAKIDCTNDGRFFHMEKLVKNGRDGGSAYVGWPYSSEVCSTWRVDNEEDDIQEYHVRLFITDKQVEAEVGKFQKKVRKTANGSWMAKWTVLDERNAATLKSGETLELQDFESFTLKGDLPLGLKVRRRPGLSCGTFTFTYGDPKEDGNRAFSFKSNDKGHGRWSHTENEQDPVSGNYCVKKEIMDTKTGVHLGTTLKCSFPGW